MTSVKSHHLAMCLVKIVVRQRMKTIHAIFTIVLCMNLSGCMSIGERYRCVGEKVAASKIISEEMQGDSVDVRIKSYFTEYEGGEKSLDNKVKPEKRVVIIGVKIEDGKGKEFTKYVLFKGKDVSIIEYNTKSK